MGSDATIILFTGSPELLQLLTRCYKFITNTPLSAHPDPLEVWDNSLDKIRSKWNLSWILSYTLDMLLKHELNLNQHSSWPTFPGNRLFIIQIHVYSYIKLYIHIFGHITLTKMILMIIIVVKCAQNVQKVLGHTDWASSLIFWIDSIHNRYSFG